MNQPHRKRQDENCASQAHALPPSPGRMTLIVLLVTLPPTAEPFRTLMWLPPLKAV